ncbi:tyrosine-type recombinase/integrase [Streptomyces sp. BBFR102]|uniref:tyrosine-type recombinase/integrase n=1 Tax=Streptomyces sp. BBFR102 TaxID=3448171 RepID=UPI003F53A44A
MWSSVKSRLDHLKWCQWYIDQVGCCGPQLVESPDQLRTWLRGFVDSLNSHITMTGPNKGGRLSKNSRRSTLVTIEAFYRWMYDNRDEAVTVLGDRRWGGLMNEVLMMDFEPLLPLLTVNKQEGKEPDGFVARLAYQQTKITGGDPPTIPVDQEIIDIIPLQQQWAREFITAQGAPAGTDPRYLFLQTRNNRLGKRPYASATFHSRLGALTKTLAITDSVGRPVKVSKTHTFRHTRATDLINAGVPIHVVMRYMGHVTPAMTMHYAKTLAVTAEREFLRYKKVTADGRTAEVNPSDLYDLLHLDQRADRVLPNGWCMLPQQTGLLQGQRLPDLRQVRHRRRSS